MLWPPLLLSFVPCMRPTIRRSSLLAFIAAVGCQLDLRHAKKYTYKFVTIHPHERSASVDNTDDSTNKTMHSGTYFDDDSLVEWGIKYPPLVYKTFFYFCVCVQLRRFSTLSSTSAVTSTTLVLCCSIICRVCGLGHARRKRAHTLRVAISDRKLSCFPILSAASALRAWDSASKALKRASNSSALRVTETSEGQRDG